MNLTDQVSQFITNPFPLWETTLTRHLVEHQWEELNTKGFTSDEQYSTAGIWLNQPELEQAKRIKVSESCLYVELPSPLLNSFYEEHGLELLSDEEIEKSQAIAKIGKALSVLKLIEPAYTCICDLVKSIHVLKQPDDEIDLSYSHPKLPFSIFVSACNDDSMISNLRVAESILHEAMHLKLTLIENIAPLVKPNANVLFFSPWRNEERPIQGVLHGLFVFKAIYKFYREILIEFINFDKEVNFLLNRIKNIEFEIDNLKDFKESTFLNDVGKKIVSIIMEI